MVGIHLIIPHEIVFICSCLVIELGQRKISLLIYVVLSGGMYIHTYVDVMNC